MPRSSARAPQGELLQGTLPLLILRTLATGPNHGFAIARRIQQISKAVLRIEQGSLYPALHRMELDGVIESVLGDYREQSKGEVLPIDEAGHARARQRNRAVELNRRSHRGGPAGGLMPRLLKRLLLRLRATVSAQQDRDTRAELDLHLRLLEEEHLAKGMAPDAAQRLARREFGNPAVFQDASRDVFSFHPIEDLVRDLRYAGREMRRSAGFTAIAVASLAVGIGAATATFAVTEAVMLRPLTVRNPARLVAFTTAADSGWATWSYAAFARWQRLPASGGLYEVAAASDVRPFRSARGSGESPEEVPVSLVSHNYFDANRRSRRVGPAVRRERCRRTRHRGRRDRQRRLLAPAVRRRARRAGEDHRTGRGSVCCRRGRRIRIHRALRRLSRRHVGPADDAAGAGAGDAGPVGP